MKEVTEWNGKPRWMWCWDTENGTKVTEFVLCILTEEEMEKADTDYPVRTLKGFFKHCAERKEETTRLTNYELSQLLKCFGVDYTWGCMSSSHNDINPAIFEEGEKIPEDYKIRYKQGEWEEPTKETVWKWWGEETPDSDIAKFVSFIGWDKE